MRFFAVLAESFAVQAARWFGEKGRTATSMWTMGVNQRTRGVWTNNLVHNLHLVTGKIGLPGSTPLSLTGQPNACGGVRDGGALSHLLPYGRAIANEKHRAEVERLWGVPAGTIRPEPGKPTMDLFQSLEQGELKVLYVMTTNPGQSLPNVDRYRRALEARKAFLVVAEAFHPTRTSELADVVLPAALWAEKEGVYGCTERRYQLLEQAVQPPGEARPDFRILCDLAARLGHGRLLPWRTPAEAWEEILSLSKGTPYDFRGMTRERLAAAHGLLWPLPSPGHPGTKRRYVKGEDPLIPPDVPGNTVLRVHPTQLYEIVAALVIFWVLWKLSNRPRRPWAMWGAYLVLYGIERFLVEFVRAKGDRYLFGLSTSQFASLIILMIGAWLWATRHGPPLPSETAAAVRVRERQKLAPAAGRR